MKLHCLYLLFCAGLFACVPESGMDRAPEDLYIVDLDCERTDSLPFSSVFGDIETVILDTGEVLLGGIDKMQVCGEGIFVLDMFQTKSLYLFAADGKLIRRIGGVGNGPGEYIGAYDFTLDTAGREVYVLDADRQRVNVYDIASGQFVRNFGIEGGDGARSERIQYCGGVLYSDAQFDFPSDSNCLLRRIDLFSGKVTAGYFNTGYNKGWNNLHAHYGPVFHLTASEAPLFTQLFMDTVYSLGADGPRPYFVLKSKDLIAPADLDGLDVMNYSMKLFAKKKVYRPVDFLMYDGAVMFFYSKGNAFRASRLDLATGRSAQLHMNNDMLFVPGAGAVYPDFGCATDQGVYYYWRICGGNGIGDFGQAARDGKLAPGLDKLEELKKMQLGANPVILFYPYKK